MYNYRVPLHFPLEFLLINVFVWVALYALAAERVTGHARKSNV